MKTFIPLLFLCSILAGCNYDLTSSGYGEANGPLALVRARVNAEAALESNQESQECAPGTTSSGWTETSRTENCTDVQATFYCTLQFYGEYTCGDSGLKFPYGGAGLGYGLDEDSACLAAYANGSEEFRNFLQKIHDDGTCPNPIAGSTRTENEQAKQNDDPSVPVVYCDVAITSKMTCQSPN